jgi:uncharacterized protein with FMN-binding domain
MGNKVLLFLIGIVSALIIVAFVFVPMKYSNSKATNVNTNTNSLQKNSALLEQKFSDGNYLSFVNYTWMGSTNLSVTLESNYSKSMKLVLQYNDGNNYKNLSLGQIGPNSKKSFLINLPFSEIRGSPVLYSDSENPSLKSALSLYGVKEVNLYFELVKPKNKINWTFNQVGSVQTGSIVVKYVGNVPINNVTFYNEYYFPSAMRLPTQSPISDTFSPNGLSFSPGETKIISVKGKLSSTCLDSDAKMELKQICPNNYELYASSVQQCLTRQIDQISMRYCDSGGCYDLPFVGNKALYVNYNCN